MFSAISHDKATEEVSKFDKSQLKHTETEEKNPLPDKDGNYNSISIHIILYTPYSCLSTAKKQLLTVFGQLMQYQAFAFYEE